MTATPPDRRAIRSLSFSRSYSCSVAAARLRICLTRASTSCCVEPSPTTAFLRGVFLFFFGDTENGESV